MTRRLRAGGGRAALRIFTARLPFRRELRPVVTGPVQPLANCRSGADRAHAEQYQQTQRRSGFGHIRRTSLAARGGAGVLAGVLVRRRAGVLTRRRLLLPLLRRIGLLSLLLLAL